MSLQGVSLTAFCVLGILANTVTIIVLSRYNVPSTFTNLLSSLAVIDTILLVVFLVDSGLERLEVDMEWYTHLIPVVHAVKVSDSYRQTYRVQIPRFTYIKIVIIENLY